MHDGTDALAIDPQRDTDRDVVLIDAAYEDVEGTPDSAQFFQNG